MANAVGRARSRRPWRLCGFAGSIVLRATFSPTRCVAAAARRELAGRLLCASHLWRKKAVSITSINACCWLVLVPVRREQLHRGAPVPAQLARRARARLRGRL